MLVVVHHWDIEFSLQTTLNLEALGCLDILKVDTAECGGDGLDCLDELLRVLLVDLYVEHVNARINLEEETFTLHDRLTCHCTDVSQAEHGCTVGDNCDKVALVGIFIGILRVALNLETRLGYTRRVCQ